MTRGACRGEDGAVLVMAMVFLTVAAIVTAALLSFADTDFRTTINIREQGAELYAADAAIEAAIDAYRTGTPCTSTMPSGPAVNDVGTVTVSCAAETITTTGGSGSTTNAPPLAIITRATQAATNEEPGIVTTSGETTRVRGGLYSNTSIDTSGGGSGGSYLNVAGSAVARTGCDISHVTSTPPAECTKAGAYAAGEDPADADPSAWAAAVTSAPPVQTAPATCPGSGPIVFQPGSYTSRAALDTLFTTCTGRIFHFPPNADGTIGVYYFDFADASGGHEWTINHKDTIMIGGTMRPTLDTVGDRCNPDAAGVQFVFGNDSRLFVNAGAVELCAQHDPDNVAQEVAVYGLKAGEAVSPTPTQQTATYSAGSASSARFTLPTQAIAPDGTSASAAISSSSDTNRTATLSLSGYNVAAVPTGATITSAVLKVTHREQTTEQNLNQLDLSVAVTGGAATAPATTTATVTGSKDAAATTSVTLPATFNNVLQLENLKVDYRATTELKVNNPRSYTALLDGIQLEVTYTPVLPAAAHLRAQAGCITQSPYDPDDPTTCAVIKTRGSQSSLTIHGTVYAPLAPLDVQLVGTSYQVFTRGVVLRHLRTNVTSSTNCTATTLDSCYAFQLPTPATTTTLSTGDVLFVAGLHGRTRLRALVRFPGPGTPTVKSWSVVNE